MSKDEVPEAFHPGEYIREEIKERGWTKWQLCSRMAEYGISELYVIAVLEEREPVTRPIAVALSIVLGTGQRVWMNLQTAYDKAVGDVEE